MVGRCRGALIPRHRISRTEADYGTVTVALSPAVVIVNEPFAFGVYV